MRSHIGIVRCPLTGLYFESPARSTGPQQVAGVLVVLVHCARRTPRSILGPGCNTRFHRDRSSGASLPQPARLDRNYGCSLESALAASGKLGAWGTQGGSCRQTARRNSQIRRKESILRALTVILMSITVRRQGVVVEVEIRSSPRLDKPNSVYCEPQPMSCMHCHPMNDVDPLLASIQGAVLTGRWFASLVPRTVKRATGWLPPVHYISGLNAYEHRIC